MLQINEILGENIYNFRILKILRQLWLSIESYFNQTSGNPFSSTWAQGQAQDHTEPCREVTSNLNFSYHLQTTVYSVLENNKYLFHSKIWWNLGFFSLCLLDPSIIMLEYWAKRKKKVINSCIQKYILCCWFFLCASYSLILEWISHKW